MKKVFLFFVLMFSISYSQTFTASELKGDVKILYGSSEKWETLKKGESLKAPALIATGKNSSVTLRGSESEFKLKSQSAINIQSLKKLSLDDLMLALAMEDIINVPAKKDYKNGKSTVTYGSKENDDNETYISSNILGIKRLNGAVQLGENGFEETAVIAAKETFRKYPDTKTIAMYRIYFADILFNKGLYEEALEDYEEIKKLNLSESEEVKVKLKSDEIKKKLLTK